MSKPKLLFLQELSVVEHILFWGLLLMVFLSPVIFTTEWYTNFSDKTGPIGDTIGGLTAPFVNLLAAFLVYKSFKAQINANELQRDNHKKEMDLIRTEFNFNSIHSLLERVEKKYEKKSGECLSKINYRIEVFKENSLNEMLMSFIVAPHRMGEFQLRNCEETLKLQFSAIQELYHIVSLFEDEKGESFKPLKFYAVTFLIDNFLSIDEYVKLNESMSIFEDKGNVNVSLYCLPMIKNIRMINKMVA